jgi:ferredoxin-NADP reductase
VQELRRLSSSTFELKLARPEGFEFSPGQYALFPREPDDAAYTMVCAPGGPTLDFCIRLTGGRFTASLSKLEPGDLLEISGPRGHFTFNSSERQAVLVATGTGIAPFVSYVKAGLAGYVLLHGARGPSELYYEEVLRPAARLYVPCISNSGKVEPGPMPLETVDQKDDAGARGPSGSEKSHGGRVTDYLGRRLPQGLYDFYLCGLSDMIREALHMIDERFPGSFVYTEPFY